VGGKPCALKDTALMRKACTLVKRVEAAKVTRNSLVEPAFVLLVRIVIVCQPILEQTGVVRFGPDKRPRGMVSITTQNTHATHRNPFPSEVVTGEVVNWHVSASTQAIGDTTELQQ
jgi:hypothetical protein